MGLGTRRVGVGVREAQVHGLEAGGARVAEPGGLEGGCAQREDGQAVVRGVSGEVHQHVQPVLPDARGQGPGAEGGGVVEGRAMGREALGHLVPVGEVRVGDDLHPRGVQVRQERLQEVGAGMAAEVRGDEAQAEAAGPSGRRTRKGLGGRGGGPPAMLRQDRLRPEPGIVVQVVEVGAAGGPALRFPSQAVPEALQALLEAPGPRQQHREVRAGLHESGPEGQGAAVGGDGVPEPTGRVQGLAEVVLGFRGAGIALRGPGQEGQGLGGASGGQQQVAQEAQQGRVLRVRGEAPPEGRLRRLRASGVPVQDAEVEVGLRIVRIQPGRGLQQGPGLLPPPFPQEQPAEIQVERRVAGRQAQGPPQHRLRFRGLPEAEGRHRAQVQGVHVAWAGVEHGPAGRQRVGGAALGVGALGLLPGPHRVLPRWCTFITTPRAMKKLRVLEPP
jgi:hypothetical protein